MPEPRMHVALFITCLTDTFYPRTGVAVVKVLEHLGCSVSFPAEQTCCGQPMYNSGALAPARDLAARMVRIFEPYPHVVTPSASCAAMVREHFPALLADDPALAAAARDLAAKTHEFSEFLTTVLRVDPAALGARWEGRATFHYACHLRGAATVQAAPAAVAAIPGLTLIPLDRPEQCCGFGGAFSVKYPDVSAAMAGDKARSVLATGAGTVICNDAGCRMNISGACRRSGAGAPPRFTSYAELLAEALGLLEPHPEHPAQRPAP